MTTTENTELPTVGPTTPQPVRPPEPERPTPPSSALAWAKLALCAANVVGGVFVGYTYSIELGCALVGAALGGGIHVVINVRR